MRKNVLTDFRTFLYISFLAFTLGACSKDDAERPTPEPPVNEPAPQKQTGRELIAANFRKTDNPSITEDAYVHKGANNIIYISIPESLIGNMATIELVSSYKSTIRVNGASVNVVSTKYNNRDVSLATLSVDISNVLTVEITSESGMRSTYDILAQKGRKVIDQMIYAFKEKYEIPGVSFAIANTKTNSVVYKTGFGFAIKETKTRVQTNHLFRLASMSKQHTAICILKLIEQGYFQLDDLVFGPTGILKDKFSTVPERAAKIKIRHLLEHTTGYNANVDFMFDSPYSGWTMEQRIDAMLKSNHPNEPGTVFAYYNTGYGILGYIIEKLSGKSFEQFMKDIYVPAGITDIHVGGTQAQRRSNEVAYYAQNGYNANGSDMSVRASAGGVIASTEQLIKLLWTIDGKSDTPDILNAEMRSLMFTPSKVGTSRYALGWRANHSFFPGAFYHGGNLAGVATFWVYGPEYAIIFLCNSRSYVSGFDDEFYVMARDIITELKKQQ